MRALPSATTVCRVLIGLDRAGASGTLHVHGEGRRATISLESSQIVGANIDRRVATSHRHVFENVLQMCTWEGLILRLVQAPAAATWWKLAEPVPARTVALQTMRAAVKGVDTASVRSGLGNTTYHLTEAGESLFRGTELRPEETAVLFWLRRGVPAEDLLTLPGCGLAGYRFVWMLKLLGAASPKAGGSYPLLLRKRRQMRKQVSAHALLDLPEGAGGRDARIALRKLVRDLHPDRFGERAPPALRRASGEIVTALVDAEARIASGRAD
ncbi:MAG: hypothetical protein JRG67_08800 [Deltaproteobacteria bacterium]|nr:hypothetical protein [Deltaproteobacteria bacterium]MBW2211132.1 hypothetical protein [Deltaproteobacteria bacterium]MBW2550493.1 hypothetical protein [Deltaproteobacteria bacterium]MBW2626214.1 hypothetical protein [Deltaproteobacteria bacterium]MBW2685558.1 hypothetical protein [Deltaproteobacteria bacterium]